METTFVASVDPWDMKDERTGERISGYSMWFITPYREESNGSLGLKPAKISVTQEIYDQIKDKRFPALCELSVGMRPGAQGKASPTVVGIRYIQYSEIFSHAAPSAGSGTSSKAATAS